MGRGMWGLGMWIMNLLGVGRVGMFFMTFEGWGNCSTILWFCLKADSLSRSAVYKTPAPLFIFRSCLSLTGFCLPLRNAGVFGISP